MSRPDWLQDPKTSDTKHFHPDPKSLRCDPRIFVDSGRPLSAEPPLLTTRFHLSQKTAEQLWLELVRVGWKPCAPQWNEDSDF